MTWEEAVKAARVWAQQNAHKSVYANAALVYIDAIELNRQEARMMGQTQERADEVQLSYVMCNLGPWRGEEAREAKVVKGSYQGVGKEVTDERKQEASQKVLPEGQPKETKEEA